MGSQQSNLQLTEICENIPLPCAPFCFTLSPVHPLVVISWSKYSWVLQKGKKIENLPRQDICIVLYQRERERLPELEQREEVEEERRFRQRSGRRLGKTLCPLGTPGSFSVCNCWSPAPPS